MADGEGHDHTDIAQHRFMCGVRQVFFDSLADELAADKDVVLGEMDIEHDILAVSVTFPEAGALFFDVSDTARPKFLSWYRSGECEAVVVDRNCGAFVDLSSDGKVAILSGQQSTLVPQTPPAPGQLPIVLPGIEVIDVADPTAPRLAQYYPISPGPPGVGQVSLPTGGGVHAARTHVIPEGGAGPREPGEYVFAVEPARGIETVKLERPGGRPLALPVGVMDIDGVHDVFVQDDALTGRTLMYVAAGFKSGFYVYDVTAPSRPRLLAEWDLTPECSADWYAHTIDVAVRHRRRYVTLPVETFEFGPQSDDPHCGTVSGNGDVPGPLWIVDATDLSALGPANDRDGDADPPELKERSQRALVTTWVNAAAAPGGNLRFTPHNQQIVGDKIYLSAYHAGVTVLDSSAAFAGRDERPRELAVVVPHGAETRPFYKLLRQPVLPFFSRFPLQRPSIWDQQFYKGAILAVDQYGGLYSYVESPVAAGRSEDRSPGDASRCDDRRAPRSHVVRAIVTRRGVRVNGTARDRGCGTSAVVRVEVAVGLRLSAGRCRFLVSGALAGPRSCRRPRFERAAGAARWSYKRRASLPRGRYLVIVRALDRAGNRERPQTTSVTARASGRHRPA